MQNNIIRKALVIGIFLSIIGASFVSVIGVNASINEDIKYTNKIKNFKPLLNFKEILDNKLDSFIVEQEYFKNNNVKMVSSDCDPIYLLPTNLSDNTTETEIVGDLQEALDNYLGSGLIDVNNDQTQYQIWNYDDYISKVTLEFEFIGNEAGNRNVFGYYFDSDPNSFEGVFEIKNHYGYNLPLANPGDTFIVPNISKSSLGYLGFAIDSQPGNGQPYKLFSENDLNPDDLDRALVFTLCNESYGMIYVVCFEDLRDNSHKDFYDATAIVRVLEGSYCLNANDDSYTVDEGATLNVVAQGILENDENECGFDITADLITGPTCASYFELNDNGSFTYVHDGSETISDSFIYNVSGTTGPYDHATVTITINPVNDPPVIYPISDKSTEEETLLTFIASASDVDIPPQILTFALDGEPTGATITSNGQFTWTPAENQGPGAYTFNVVVSDGIETDSTSVNITVVEVNIPPTLNSIGDKEVDEQTQLTFTATATDPDIPTQTLTFSLDGEPTGATITTTGTFTWTPTENQGPDTYTLDIIVTDGITTDSETITITVTEINQPPELNPIDEQSVDENTSLTVTFSATDPDIPGQTLTFSTMDLPDFGTLIDNGDGTGSIQFDPDFEDEGTYEIIVTVTDDNPSPLSDSESFILTVNHVNQPPIAYFSYTIDDLTAYFDGSGSYDNDGTITDYIFNFGDGEKQSGMILDHTYEEYGTYTVKLSVTDDDDSTTNLSKTINIFDFILPEINDNTPKTGYTGDVFTFEATITDLGNVENAYVEYWFGSGSHTNITMNNYAGDDWEETIIVDSSTDILHYIISAYDSSNNWNDTGIMDVIIYDNDAPVIINNSPSYAIAGYPYVFNVTVIDNIELSGVYVEYWYDNGVHYNESMTDIQNNLWEFTITVDLASNILHYVFSAVDLSDNWANTETIDVSIIQNDEPSNPIIDGPNTGKPDIEYDYTFVSTDPNGDDLYYFIDWGDGNTKNWFGPFESGEIVTVSHTYAKKSINLEPMGTKYIIKAKAKDIFDSESGWGEFEVTMPKNKPLNLPFKWLYNFLINNPILLKMFEVLYQRG
ncbi:hypothetical protein AYK24_03215 [Thermoplasmatales archaeon SG8-52-4]|nr:MAG: hypothetical protein AYK24_03215 [Thermoplasmatales archaeon SG8-52-4]